MRALIALCVALLGGCGPLLVWHGRSPDRARRAEVLEEDGRRRVVVDGAPDADRWDAVVVTHLRWTEAGLVYPARRGERWHLVVDGTPGPPHAGIGAIATAADHVAYAALDEDGWRVVTDGAPGPAFASLREGTLVLSDDGARVAHVGRDASGEHAVVDGAVGPAFDAVEGLTFGAKGRLVAYVGYDARGARIVVDGRPGGRFDEVTELAVAPDEPRWAAIAIRGERAVVVRDGEVIAEAPAAAQLTLARDGAHVAWTVPEERRERGERREPGVAVFSDGARVGRHAEVSRLSFVPRTGALVYVAENPDGARVVHDGDPGPRFDEIEGPVVGATGRWGYVGTRRAGCAVVVDGTLRLRDAWAGSLAFAARSDRWAFLARRGGRHAVVTPDDRVEVPRPIVDSFVLGPHGRHWAVAVADRSARRLRVVVDGRDVAPLDADEISAALLQVSARGDVAAIVRRIVRGQLINARTRPPAADPARAPPPRTRARRTPPR